MIKTIRSTPMFPAIGAVLAVAVLSMTVPAFAHAEMLTRQLQIEMTGSDVSTLQSFLAEDTSIYPQGLVTGYFGFLTKSAVSNYQSRNGIDTVGRVGPITLASINAQMAGGASTWDNVPVLGAVTVNTTSTGATITWGTNEPTRGAVYYSTSPLSESEGAAVVIGGTPVMSDSSFRSSHSISIANLLPNTTYYYDVYVTDTAGGDAMTMQKTFRTTN